MKKHIVGRCIVLIVCLSSVGAAFAESKIGVVVMHGKWGTPQNLVKGFAEQIEQAGFITERPEMPWSKDRLYDAGVVGMVADIDAAAQSLRAKGAEKICLAGHSLGAAGAIKYVGLVKVDCLIVMAPGHNPESQWTRDFTASDLSKAKEMVAKGVGEERAEFEDFNSGNRRKKISMRASVFIEYFDGDGPFNMAENASKIRPGTPVLWVVGLQEGKSPRQYGDAAYARILEGAPKKFVEVPGGHLETPKESGQIAIEWMRERVK